MTDADSDEFMRALGVLAETFGETVSEERAAAYFESLRDLSFDTVREGIARATAKCRFFPRPVELRPPEEKPDPGAIFAEIIAAKRHAGWEHSLPAVTPLVGMVIDRLGGWRTCWGLTDDYLWLRVRDLTEGAVAACEARGLPLQIAPSVRPALPGPLAIAPPPTARRIGQDVPPTVAATLSEVLGGMPAKPMPHADLTPDELDARKATLREQARQLGVKSR